MDSHGIDGYGQTRIEELVNRITTFNFESYLTQAIGGTGSGCFSVEEDEHVVTGFILYKSFQNPIRSVPDAKPQWQHYSWSTKWSFFEYPGIETHCCETED